jgi:hypothetical protein
MARIFIYIDDMFQGKTELMDPSHYPIFNFNLDLILSESSKEIRFDLYDASGLTKHEIKKMRTSRRENPNIVRTSNPEEVILNFKNQVPMNPQTFSSPC